MKPVLLAVVIKYLVTTTVQKYYLPIPSARKT